MKKIFISLILILCSMVCVACSCGKDATISFRYNDITINVGETYEVSDDFVKIVNSNSDFRVMVDDLSIARIEGNNIIALQEGVTSITIELVNNPQVYCKVKLVVTNIIYATSVEIEYEDIQINMKKSMTATNKLILNEGCNEIPDISYDSSIISYNYKTGEIVALSEGTTNVVIIFDGCNVGFSVRVVDIAYTSKMVVDDTTLFVDSEGVFDFQVFPYYANTYSFFSTSDLIEVSANGEYVTKKIGEAIVYCEYLQSAESSVLVSFKVNILSRLETFGLKIVEKDTERTPRYYLQEKEYRLRLNGIEGVPQELISISSIIDYHEVQEDEKGLYIDFCFNQKGDLNIEVRINMGTEEVCESVDVTVYNSEDVELKAKILFVIQGPLADGKYHLYLNGENGAKSLYFVAVVGGIEIDEEIKVYLIVDGERVQTIRTFSPQSVGDYIFEIEIIGRLFECVHVVVE